MNIFVSKLSYKTNNDSLVKAFEIYGTVMSANIILDKVTGRSKGFGFVEMEKDEDAKQAIQKLHNSELDGNQIVVKQAEPRRM